MKNDSIKKNKLNNSAFTLVEVIATVVILGIILIIILTGYTKYVKNSKTKYDSEQTNLFIQAGKDYFNDNRNFLPTDKGKKSCVTLKTLIENKYIGKIYDSDKKPYSNDSKVCAVKVSLTKYSYTGKLLHYGETETEYEQGFHPKNFTISFTSSKQGEKNIVKMTIESEYKITSYKYIIHKVTTEEGNETDKTVLVKGPISVSEKDKVSVDIKLDNTGTYYIQAESYNEKNQRVVAKSTNFTQNVTKMDCSNSVSVTEGTTNWTNKDIRNKINVNSDTVKYYYFTVKNSYNDYIVEDTRQINTSDSNGVFYHNITASDGETKNVYYEIIPYDKNGKNNNCVIRTSNFKIDKVKPTCQVKSSNTEWTNQNVTVNAQCQDRDSKCIQSEKVKVINSDHVGEYVVTFNDNAGNTVNCESQYIKVDKTAPSVNVTTTNNFKSTTQKATLKCSDNNGIIGYYFGTTAPTSSTTYNTVTSTKDLSIEETINSNGKYYFYCKDVAGNSKGATKEYINYTVNNMYQNQTGSTYTIGNYTQSSNNTYIISKGTTLPLTEIYTIPTGSNPNRFVGITNGNPSTTAVTPSTASIVLNEEMTFTTWFTRNVMYFKYKTNGGTIQKTTHNADNTTTYNWGVDNNGYITLNNSNNFTNYRYGTTSINLYDYNNRNAMYIYKTGYTTTPNQEWICESGCKENNQVFSHSALTYSSSNDICNAENSDCTAVVKVNWKRQTYNINYELNGGTNNSSNPINYNVDSNNITINSPTRGDYTFEGWTEQIKDLVWHSGFINLNTGIVETNSDNPSSYYTDMIKLNSGTKYTLGGYGSYSGSAIRWRIYDLNGAYKKNVTATEYTPDADCYVRILFYNAPTSAQRTGTIITSTPGKNATITKGSTHNRLYTGSWSKDSSKLNVELSETSYIYDGNNKEPIVIVKDGNEILVRDKDYTLTYSNNKNAGTAKVIITGKGTYNNTTKTKYIGTKEVTFIINRKPIAFPTCSDKTYTAKEQTLFEAHTSGEYTNAVLKGTNVNSYTTDLTPAANYEWSSGSNVTSKRTLTCKIVKSNTTTSLSEITKTYTGSAQAASGATAKLNSTNEAISGGSYTYTYYSGESCGTALSGAPTNAGKYSVKATLTGTSNYNTSTSGCVKYTMNQKKATITLGEIPSLTYGTDGVLTYTYDGDGEVSCTSSDTSVVTCAVDRTNKKITLHPVKVITTNVTITVSAQAGTNYSGADNKTATITVRRKPIAFPTCSDKTYTAKEQTLFEAHTSGEYTNAALKGTNVNSYTTDLTPAANYEWSSGSNVTSKRTLTCKIVKSNTTTSLSEITKTYTGSAQAASGATAKLNSTNEAISGGSYTYTYYSGESCGTALSGAPKNAGKYSVKATLTGTSNYNTSTSGCVKYTMNQKKATITLGEIPSLTYGTDGVLTYTYDGDGEVSCTSSDTSVVTCTVDRTNKKITLHPVKVITTNVTITVSAQAGTNYSGADNKTATITVRRKPIAFPTCSDKTYTAKEQTLFAAHTSGEYTNAVLKGTNVNSYTTDLTPTANYEWSSGSNVTSKRTLTCKIVKSNTTTSLSAITKTYTGSAQAASGATAKLNSTNEAISGGSYTYTYYSGESCGTALSGAPTNAGKYSVKATLTGTSNYNTSTSGCVKYTMNYKKPTMSISPTSGTLTYGTNGTITVTTDGDGTISCTTSDSTVATCSVSGKTVTVTPKANTADGKKATITVKQAAGTNYSAADNETYSVTVNRKTITCPTATSSQTKIYTGSSIASGVSCPTGSTAGGTTSATNVGSYSHTCDDNSGYKFSSTCSVAWSINYAKITFNKGTCDSISGSTSLYAKKNTTSLYTGAQNSTAGTIPSASKTGYTFNGWYTGTSGGSKVIDSSKNVIASISNWTDENKKWLLSGNSNVNAHCTYSATPTITKTDFNTFSYSATGADKYFVSAANTSTAPTASSTWVTTKSKTISSAGTYYVWAQNSAGDISTNKASITAYTISRSATNGTLTSRYDSTSSSTGTAFTNNTVMLKNTDVWAKCEASTGYHVTDTSLKHGSTAIAGGSGTFKVTANETLSCAPTANTYTVQYCQGNNSDTAGSKCSSTTSSHAYGTAKKLTAYSSLGFTEPKGWEFAGWSTSQTGTSVSTVNSVKLTDQANVSNLTSTNGGTVKLHAVFKRTVKFNSGASCGTTSTATQYYNPYKNAGYITAVSFPAPKLIIADKGWSVLGYRGDKTASTEDFSVTTTAVDKTPGSMRHDITNGASTTLNLYAVYKRTITAYHGKAKNNSTTLTQYANCSSNTVSAVTLPAPNTSSFTADTKWAAVGYRDDTTAGTAELAVTTASASLKPAYNLENTLYAVYSRNLTMAYDGNENNEGSTASHTKEQYYNTNGGISTVTFTTAANGFIRYGYESKKWANDSVNGTQVTHGSTATGFAPGVDSTSLTKTMYAAWVEKTHTMEVNPNGGTWNSTTDTSSVSYVVSNKVYATTKPTRTGYTFTGWSNQTKVSPSKDDPSFSGDTFNDDDVYPYNNVANAATKYYYGGSSVSSTANHDVISRGTGLGSTFANSGNIITIGKYANSDYESGNKARSPFGSYAFAIYNPPEAKITAGAKPGFGGFYQIHTPTAGHTYLHVIGVICGNDTKGNTTYLHFNHNSLGTGGNDSAEDGYGWVTQNRCMKTNETESAWKIYMYKIKYGTGDIGTFGHVYFSDKANNGNKNSITSGAHFSAYVGYSMVYDITSNDSAFGQVNSSKTSKLTANWSVGVYQIKFNEQGGTKSSNSNSCMYEKYNNGYYLWSSMESKYQITTSQAASGWGAPSKPGYTFGGYYTETNGGGTQIITSNGKLASGIATTRFTAGATLYAKWVAGEYKITFNKQKGSGGNDWMFEKYGTGFNQWSTFPSGDEVTTSKALDPPSRSGYTFHGYYTETNGKGKQIITASGKLAGGVTSKEFTAATTIYASWETNVTYYKCTFTYNYVSESTGYCRLPSDVYVFFGSWSSSSGFYPTDGCHAATENGTSIGVCKSGTILNYGNGQCENSGYSGWSYYNPGGGDGKCKCMSPSYKVCSTTTSTGIYTSKLTSCYLGNSSCAGGAKCTVSCTKQ